MEDTTQTGDPKNLVFLSGEAQPLQQAADGQRFWVEHPSCRAPKCVDCKHIEQRWQQDCQHPAQPRHLDDGRSKVRCHAARGNAERCAAEGFFFCGEAGALFEPAVQAV